VNTAPKAVIWDVDGTLIDSGDAHWQSWRAVFAQDNLPDLDYPTFISWFGRRNDDILRDHFGPEPTEEGLNDLAERKESHYRDGLRQQPSIILPGVTHWLETLATDGWKLGIGSSAAGPNLDIILEQAGWNDTFGVVMSRETVAEGKPHPEVFLTAAAHLGVDPSRAIVVEDAAAGVLGAHRAGMRTIGVGTHYNEIGAMVAVPSLDLLAPDAFDRLLELPLPENIG
jgi:HAD superfamily hydrolase (TIGR01509 family)